MGLWPFGRSKKKTNSATGETHMGTSKGKTPEGSDQDPGNTMTDVNASRLGKKVSRRESLRAKGNPSRKLKKPQQSRAREPEKRAPLPAQTSQPQAAFIEPEQSGEKVHLPDANAQSSRPLAGPPKDRGDIPSYYFQNPASQTSIQAEQFTALPRVPTLRAKRSAYDPNSPRRKSSKKKADDNAREQEIKAMSAILPVSKRPTSHASGLLARESKRIPGGLNRNFERPTSEVSIPLPESVHSSMSEMSDRHAFKISALDALSPRPTIRYSENSGHAAGASPLGPSRASTRKEKRATLPEVTVKSGKRIDDLADDLDAGSLRELMERDQRRREKKRGLDQERLQRKLQRKAEKQREYGRRDQEAAHDPLRKNLERGAAGRETVGLGFGEASTSAEDDERHLEPREEDETEAPASWPDDLSKEHLSTDNPFLDPGAGASGPHTYEPVLFEEREEPVVETAQAVRLSQASMLPPTPPIHPERAPSRLSQLIDLAGQSTPDIQEVPGHLEPLRRDSDASATASWTSFFKRGPRPNSIERGRKPVSEFSNTSRESFARQLPPGTFTRNVKARSGTPIRTQSRFKEDLPELPVSPPDSRVQSPEAPEQRPGSRAGTTSSPIPGMIGVASTTNAPLSLIHPAFREEVALSRQASFQAPSPDIPSSAILSQSLASVDSEASWLSGRPVKRTSQQKVESADSLLRRTQEAGVSDDEDRQDGKESFTPFTPAPEEGLTVGKTTTTGLQHEATSGTDRGNSDDDDEEDSALYPPPESQIIAGEAWHSGVGRSPTVVRQDARVKSREGLLNYFQAGDESAGSSPSDNSPETERSPFVVPSEQSGFIHRAMSVDYGKRHARHISAGSARLLNLPARASGESKRLSSASGERSPLGPPSPVPLSTMKSSEH
ncbi:hypothetical protein LPUS_10031 [Lasallia pustulata]|uniref:Uncharacterized protein n=1 Tax=Lasallia pustulata TaxID=136370 RepID=A0A1W5D8W4_9LECA|nr:hypothetical protein LPUS_10031 [Lasallia pustulata]